MSNVTEYITNGAAGYVPVREDELRQQRLEYKGRGRSLRVKYIPSISAYEKRKKCPLCHGELLLTRKHNCFEDFVCKGCKTKHQLNIISEELALVQV